MLKKITLTHYYSQNFKPMKLLKTILLSITFLSAGLLWLTRDQYLPSLSAFALSPNAMFYRTMHISAAFFFLINAIDFKKYATEFVCAAGMALILIFDMYNTPTLHNVFTVATLLLVCFTLLVNVKKTYLNKTIAISLVAASIVIFAIGYFTNFHLFFAEVIAMAFLSTGKLIETHNS